ncbi:insulin-degrading enzyme-like [Babylonia areolata]|uniref:insulin-degrading enzyme-like n=1 Tax=Babylonia areolata TaxID=304850 RepID=UPI003FD13FF6
MTTSLLLPAVVRQQKIIVSLCRCLSTMAKAHIRQVIDSEAIRRSETDLRQYRGLELNNGMKVLLVSDKDTDKSAAGMDVHIGSMKDPREVPGLAHFCEHMLFLGTEKYPEENAYSKFLSEHGGSSNAFTSLEHTNYFFDVAPDGLAGALDRFAQFFLCPLFTPSATEREVNAVNSENDRNLQSDPWRMFQLEKSQAKPDHDYNKFATGNKESLMTEPSAQGIDVREQLLHFHNRHYSSNIMGLAVLGRESLDELTEMVVPLFCGVEDKQAEVPEWTDPPYGPEQKQKITKAVPVKDTRDLGVTWSIPDLLPYYKMNPGHYLGHLLGHEGPGSLLSELKARGWVNTLCGGQKHGAKGYDFFAVNVDLTEEGQEHVEDIITLMYQYINMLKKEGPQEWVFKECKDLSAMQFRFKDKEKPRNYVCSLSSMLQDYPMKEVLSAPYLFTEYRPELITMILNLLTPDNMRVHVSSKKFEGQTDQTEKWYGTHYRVDDLPSSLLEEWKSCGLHDNLRLPDRNEFIPSDFDLVPRESGNPALPEIIRDTPLSRLWYKQDDKFLKPKACISFDFASPYAYIDPLHANLNTLFVELFKDALNEYAYAAEIAGLGYNLVCSLYGITLEVKGYNDKLEILLKKILDRLTCFTVNPQRFDIIKEAYERGLRNFRAEQPHQHAVYYTTVIMSEVIWTKDELLSALEDVTVEKLEAFIPQLLSLVYAEGLIYGNVTKQKAIDITVMMEETLKTNCKTKALVPSLHRKHREIQLPDGCYYVHQQGNEVHNSSSLEIYYQVGMQNTESNALLELFCQVIGDQCFNVLRTQEQLGYIVFSGVRRAKGVQGLRVIIQSNRSPAYVEGRVEAFLQKMEGEIRDMGQEDFKKHVSALVTRRLEKPKRLAVQNAKYWTEILCQQYNFDRDNVEVEFLKTVTKDDLFKFYKEKIALDAPQRHKLSVHIVSQAGEQNNGGTEEGVSSQEIDTPDGLMPPPLLPEAEIVQDIVDFKQSLPLYPLVRPFIDLTKARSKL